MNFVRLSENSQFNENNKNIALLTNEHNNHSELYEGVFIFHSFDEFKDENTELPLDYLGNDFLDNLDFFITDENNINIFIDYISSSHFSFDLIIIHHKVFDSEFFDLNLLNLIIEASKSNNIKVLFDIGDNVNLFNTSFYDDSKDYLLRTLIQNVDLITTSDNFLKSELINFNDGVISIPPLSEFGLNFSKLFKKWIILLKSLFNNYLILDVIVEYMTESAEYDIIYNSNENNYKISVIIPIYNTGEKLRRTLRSIEYQTIGMQHIEVLMVNDCSTDEVTLNILKEYVQKDNFKWIDLKENQGHSGIPRNIGLRESSAEYIIFLDHDDFFEVSALQKLYDAMISEENELDLVFGTYSTVQNENSVIYFDDKDKNGYIDNLTESPRLVAFPPPSIWTKLFKKSFIIKNNILFPPILGEDAIFMNKSFLKAKGIKYLQKSLITFHDLGKQSITNNVTLKYLRQGIFSERYLKDYFETKGIPEYFKYRVDVLANFFLKKFINQANLTEKEIRLIFPKYVWAMNQVKEYGSDLLFNEEICNLIVSNNLEKITKIKLPKLNKQNILYVTVLDETKSFPLIDSLDELLENVNIYAITYTDLKIKLWSCNLDKFTLLKEIKFNDKIPNFNQLNNFYEEIFDNLKIDKVFFRHFSSYSAMFYFRSMIQTPRITPLSFASNRNIVTLYGENSKILLDNLNFKYHDKINLNPQNEKGVVYTAIFGDYEPLLDPKVINKNLDYICFTDNPDLKSDVWTVKVIPDYIDDFNNFNNEISFTDLDYTRRARTIKTLPHVFLKDYDFSIWVDAGFLITGDIIEFINRYTEKDFLGITHSVRNCLYDEANEVLRLKIDDENLILKQIERYKKDNYPTNNGLIESGILFRRHNNPKLVKVMEDWFAEIFKFSKRDQISFNYVAWKHNLDFDLSNIYYARNPYFHHYFHRVNTVNNKATLNEFRVILLDTNTLENVKKSVNKINEINDFIPISVITNNKNILKYLGNNLYNLEIIYTEGDLSSEFINNIASNKSEKVITVMNAGKILDYELILKNI